MRKFYILVLLLLAIPLIIAGEKSSSSINWVSRGFLENNICSYVSICGGFNLSMINTTLTGTMVYQNSFWAERATPVANGEYGWGNGQTPPGSTTEGSILAALTGYCNGTVGTRIELSVRKNGNIKICNLSQGNVINEVYRTTCNGTAFNETDKLGIYSETVNGSFTECVGTAFVNKSGTLTVSGIKGETGAQGAAGINGTSGAINFTQLNDTPKSYLNQAGRYVKVNSSANGLFFDKEPNFIRLNDLGNYSYNLPHLNYTACNCRNDVIPTCNFSVYVHDVRGKNISWYHNLNCWLSNYQAQDESTATGLLSDDGYGYFLYEYTPDTHYQIVTGLDYGGQPYNRADLRLTDASISVPTTEWVNCELNGYIYVQPCYLEPSIVP